MGWQTVITDLIMLAWRLRTAQLSSSCPPARNLALCAYAPPGTRRSPQRQTAYRCSSSALHSVGNVTTTFWLMTHLVVCNSCYYTLRLLSVIERVGEEKDKWNDEIAVTWRQNNDNDQK